MNKNRWDFLSKTARADGAPGNVQRVSNRVAELRDITPWGAVRANTNKLDKGPDKKIRTRREMDYENLGKALGDAVDKMHAHQLRDHTPYGDAYFTIPAPIHDHLRKHYTPEWETNAITKLPTLLGAKVIEGATFSIVFARPSREVIVDENGYPQLKCGYPYDVTKYTLEYSPYRFLPLDGLAIHIKSRVELPFRDMTPAESQAIDTLRDMITETEFRRYLKYGFVLVKGASGATYQVFRNQSHTRVWRDGKVIEEVCIRLRGSGWTDHEYPDNGKIPPTDNIIAFKNMIEADEEGFKKSGNLYKMVAA